MHEYAAWKYSETSIPGVQFGGKGTLYAEFVMDVVKPFIDKVPDQIRQGTYGYSWFVIGGSIAVYGISCKIRLAVLGVFHPANWLHQDAFDRFIERKAQDPSQRVYIYVVLKKLMILTKH